MVSRGTVAFKGSHADGIRINTEVTPLRHTPYDDPVQTEIHVTGRLAILGEPAYAILAGFNRDCCNRTRSCESMNRVDRVTTGECVRATA